MLNDLYKDPTPESTNYFFCESTERVIEAAEAPVIVHFTHELKPWLYACYHEKRYLYLDTLKKTAWADYKFPDKSTSTFIRRSMNQLALRLLCILPNFLKNKIVAKVFG